MTPAAPAIPEALRHWLAGKGLTPRQHDAACAFYRLCATSDYAPTLRELADALGISKAATVELRAALAAKGVIDLGPKFKSRGVRLLWGEGSVDGGRLRAEAQLIRRVGEEIRKSFPGYAHQLAECAGRLEAAVGNEVARDALKGTV